MPPIDTPPHTVVAQRFVIEEAAGSGGMGMVYRAHDRASGNLVALKLIHGKSLQPQDLERFSREAQLLAELRHPNIVGYVAHGQPEEGLAYLAMEWLEGEDLDERLSRGRLTVRETLLLIEKVANGLAMAHRRSVVHRDLKPSNIFLREGQIERATLLDFGLARRAVSGRHMTKSGTVLGTLDYMAPEQARGHSKEIGPAADIFSLGSVFYECLTGQAPFSGEEMAAVLAKILFEEVPPIRRLLPQIPRQVESLVMRMLAKDPHQRPADATALLGELASLGELSVSSDNVPSVSTATPAPASTLMDREQLLVSVVIATPPRPGDPIGFVGIMPRSEEMWAGPGYSSVRRQLTDLGAFCELLADGTLVAALMETGSATDQVVQAARCALHIQERWPEARVALATGRGQLNEQLPVGEAIERAARLVRSHKPSQPETSASPHMLVEGVWLDDVSAGLLDARFLVAQSDRGAILQCERLAIDESRTLLGRPTPCVGREQELGTLDAALSSCIDESGARAVMVTAAPGIGKSRLRHEFLRRLEAQALNLQILVGRCEPMSAGSPYAVLNHALRRLCDLTSRDSPAEQRAKLRARLTRYVAPGEIQRVGEFLGELCQLPFPDDASVKMRAARNDPKIMRDQIGLAFLAWLRGECAQHPVLLILEDLHWGDPLTARLIDISLRELADQPFMVLGLARPEVMQLFPNLWEERRVQKLRLGLLTRKVCERFVYQILGRDVKPQTVARIVEQAAGNALYLEELVRAVAEGKGDALPETVLAMLQSRISRLEPSARRILRGASLFGSTFWRGGLLSLYGVGRGTTDLERWMAQLISSEIIEQHRESRFPEEVEYQFRHSLMRDAAYSLLTEEDRRLGHHLVADYLELLGEKDAMVLAEHLREADEPERAIAHYLRAAEQSYTGNDAQGTLDRARKAEACGASGENLGTLRALQFKANFWRGDWGEAFRLGLEALPLLPPGSRWWGASMSSLLIIAGNINQPDRLQELVQRFAEVKATPDGRWAYLDAACQIVTMFSLLGVRAPAALFLERMLESERQLTENDAESRGFIKHGHGWYARFLLPDPWLAFRLGQESVAAFQAAGDLRNVVLALTQLGMAESDLGDFAGAEETLRNGLLQAERLHESVWLVTAKMYLASFLVTQESRALLDEAERLVGELIALNLTPTYTGFAYSLKAQLLLSAGAPAEAEEIARKAAEMMQVMDTYRISALVLRTRALLALDRPREARLCAEEGLSIVEALDVTGFNEVSIRLAAAEALRAVGDIAAANQAIERAKRALEIRAKTIPDDAARTRFLSVLRDNARTLALHAAWLGPHEPVGTVQTA